MSMPELQDQKLAMEAMLASRKGKGRAKKARNDEEEAGGEGYLDYGDLAVASDEVQRFQDEYE